MRNLVASVTIALATSQAGAVTVVNGDFEQGPTPGADGTIRLDGGDTSLPGWIVVPQGVDYFDASYLPPQSGDRAVELSAALGGGVAQNVSGFTAGRVYELRFYLSANPFNPDTRPVTTRTIVSATGGDPVLYTYTLTGQNSPTDMRYQYNRYRFVASASGQRIQFRGQTNSEFGPILDNVTIAEVPEPATWSLLILGFGLVGYAARRRVATVTA